VFVVSVTPRGYGAVCGAVARVETSENPYKSATYCTQCLSDIIGVKIKPCSQQHPQHPPTPRFSTGRWTRSPRASGSTTSCCANSKACPKPTSTADTRLETGQIVRVPPVRVAEKTGNAAPAREFEVLHEDAGLLAIHKPAGVAVHGGSGVSFGVIEQMRAARPDAKLLELVHRLDRETSGVLLIAKKRSVLVALQDQFRARSLHKTYLAVVLGVWPEKKKVIDKPLHKFLTEDGERRVRIVGHEEHDGGEGEGKRSISLVRVRQRIRFDALNVDLTELEVTIKTGRTHQIRVHLAGEGCPIVGDEKYGDFEHNKQFAKLGFKGMYLHAWRLRLNEPPLELQCEPTWRSFGDIK
jgi:23S rRNA pseudouridine955/2504/2580 synthase